MKKFLLPVLALLAAPIAHADFTIDNYNEQLPVWGTSWQGDYRPSFYTGFAARQENPERIHIRPARGNQIRVSVILDEQTLADYTFDLAKRYQFYKKAQKSIISNTSGNFFPQLNSFYKVVESSNYGILAFTQQATAASEETLAAKGLELLQALNPGRVFNIRLNLSAEFAKWKAQVRENSNWAKPGFLASNPKDAIIAINTLVFGRVNFTSQPSPALLGKLTDLAALAQSDDAGFTQAAADLFKELTGNKYKIRVLENGRFENAIRCESANDCTLNYPEFTAIYPTGSAESFTKDQFGNTIPNFATQGLWQFYNAGMGSVDSIRDEGYYGWIPKMNFQQGGNGFHNPAVRFFGVTKLVHDELKVPASHNVMWLVKRGGVSHGCLRMAAGHAWELRQILPVENDKVLQVDTFNSASRDFDAYDIDGDGNPEVMGVDYLVNYDAKGGREVSAIALSVNSPEGKYDFYKNLYGAKGDVFTREGTEKYSFNNPSVSLPSYMDFRKQQVSAHVLLKGSIPFYEAAYEQDKIQFYNASINKNAIRLMGRVHGCAPTSNKKTCGEAAFDNEAATLVR